MNDDERRLMAEVRPAGWRPPEPWPIYDLVVLGGGTAGLVSAAAAGALGARVALVERHRLGGDCLHSGCVPSKALVRAARLAAQARAAEGSGVTVTARVDFGDVMRAVGSRRADLAHHDSAHRFATLGVHVFFGSASFSGPRAVDVDGRTLRFRRAVIATGSRPRVPPIPGLADAAPLTSETLFALTGRPRTLVVIGGGPMGCEIAQVFARFGTGVTLLEVAPRILPGEDPDAAALVAGELEADGVRVVTGSVIAAVRRTDGAPTVEYTGGVAVAEALLVAAGRAPNIEALGLEAAGVRVGPDGIAVDDRLRTSNARVYAAGDVCSSSRFTHAADAMARIVVQNALFFGRRRVSALVIPHCIYTSPELAHVGLSAAGAARLDAETLTVPYADLDRAVIDGSAKGFLRIHHRRGRIVGATVVGEHAGELVGYFASAMTRGARLGELSGEIFPYPTLAEGVRKVGDAYRRSRLSAGLRAVLRYYFGATRSM
jgi:pyruvate/2-oxoglutarate dehydrogenase complex dihydrolipoamide dehydrogenase (E3) component